MKQLSKLCLIFVISILAMMIFFYPKRAEANVGTFVSDDFNSFNLNTGLWTFVNPLGDASVAMMGTNTQDAWASISIPEGIAHDLWLGAVNAPRLMQPANNEDFELETKFESGVTTQFQMQGIVVEQDSNNFLRFDFHSDGMGTRVLATSFTGGIPVDPPIINSFIAANGVAPLYMRVKRVGDLWTQSYSLDGQNWTDSGNFTHSLIVSEVGTFVGNAGSNPPAHTSIIDYFFNNATPVTPEDGDTGVVDSAPPFIHNNHDTIGATKVKVNWSTDELATSAIKYGQTASYELGSVDDNTPSFDHSLMITGLQPTTVYSYQIVSEDSINYVSSSSNFTITTLATESIPVIDVWYGTNQQFGQIGIPQRWVNILGNVSDPDGIDSLEYSLNGGAPRSLSIGPDNRRLARLGDFNIDIDRADLTVGSNQVVITATDILTNTSVETVTVEYDDTNVWPLPYTIDWSTVTDIQDVTQIVDGKWALDGNGIHPVEPDYDRAIAIGDLTWTDYVITVPITIHDVDIAGSGGVSGPPGLGLLLRWTGHTDQPVSGWQPKVGWEPNGRIGWWRWDNSGNAKLELYETGVEESFTPALETLYWYKMQVASIPGEGGEYRVKVWEDGQPEPFSWDLTYQEGSTDLANGSLLLLAHHVDATFGDVTIAPLAGTTATLAINTSGSGSVTKNPNPPGSEYTFGQQVQLTAVPDSGWTFNNWEGDLTGSSNPATVIMTSDKVITATFKEISGADSTIVSDDFNACSLNTGLWNFINPQGDGTVAIEGSYTNNARVSISVPGGTSHDVWTGGNQAPRIMQPANDTDFQIEVKFDSGVDSQYQLQGIIVEQDSDNFLRLDFYSDGSNTRILATTFSGGSPTIIKDNMVTTNGNSPLYMRVKREGNLWTQSYSLNGTSWTTNTSFTFGMIVSSVGAFAGNAGGSPPAHTALIDYFFNTASPISPEDGLRNTLTVNISGNGSVGKNPDKTNYACDAVVQLTAAPDPDSTFIGWSGDLTGTTSPANITMNGPKVVTAAFILTADSHSLTINTVGNGTVTKNPNQASYQLDAVVQLTATPDPGWTFSGWSGDLTGTTNPANITMTGNKVVTATFIEQGLGTEYYTFLPLIIRN